MHIVQVRIEDVRSAGFVATLLEDGRRGFIPRRELSLDQSVRSKPIQLEVGGEISAVLLPSSQQDGYLQLSLRQMADPWIGAEMRFPVDQPVRGEVVNLRNNAAYVQIEPGIVGVIWNRELPLKRGQLPSDILEVGDQLLATVTEIDEQNRRLELSLMQYLRQLPQSAEERNAMQRELICCLPSDAPAADPMHQEVRRSSPMVYHPPIARLNNILVVDDNPDELRQTVEWLHGAYGANIDAANSGEHALELVSQGKRYDIAIIDVRLGNSHGKRVAEELHDIDIQLAFVFVSSDPQAETDIGFIGGQRHLFSVKQQDSVIECVDKLFLGYSEAILSGNHTGYVGQGGFADQLGISVRLRRPLHETVTDILRQLRAETRVTYAMVVVAKPYERAASILACAPELSEEINRLSQDGLYYSPARQVAEYSETIYATKIRQDLDLRFKNFFPLLAYSTCLGIPLTGPDISNKYALFLLDERLTELSDSVRATAQMTVPFLETALERAELFEVMQRYEHSYTHGQLLGSLAHELHAKLRGMSGQLERLEGMLAQLELPLQPSAHLEYLQKASDATKKLCGTRANMVELVDAYARLVRREFEAVDVNMVVKKAVSQLARYARDSEVELLLDLGHPIPHAEAITSRLEQIVINLVLNAVQQIKRQRDFFHELDRQQRHGDIIGAFAPVGVVTVRTCYRRYDPSHPIKIVVLDTGPGIHYSLERRLFQLNTSTRAKGQGLGLYISRNLADFMACHLQLADSILFVGSAFALELRERA